MLTEEAVKRVDSGKKQSDVVERTIRHMADSLTEHSGVSADHGGAEQQQIGFDQVTQALKNIRQAADQTAVSTSQLEKAATNLTGLGQQLQQERREVPHVKDIRQRLAGHLPGRAPGHVQRIREILRVSNQRTARQRPGSGRSVPARAQPEGRGSGGGPSPDRAAGHRLETLFSRVREGAVPLDQPRRSRSSIRRSMRARTGWRHPMRRTNRPPPAAALEAIDALLGTRRLQVPSRRRSGTGAAERLP